MANQTRPDMANAVRAVARFSRDPKEVHVEAARKIIEYLSASAHLGLTFRKDSELDIYICAVGLRLGDVRGRGLRPQGRR